MTPKLWWDWNWVGAEDVRPWAVIGKGPSFARRGDVDWSQHQTIGLNHVVREMDVTVAHAIDVDVFDQVSLDRWMAAEVVVVPWRPHVGSRPAGTLADHVRTNRTLRELHRAGRLRTYNLALGGRSLDSEAALGKAVGVRYFSAEAAFNLLIGAGAKHIGICGVDGRDSYADEFHDLRPLENGRKSFDEGIAELQRIARRNRVAVLRLPWNSSPDAELYRRLMHEHPNYGGSNHGGAAAESILQQLGARAVVDVGCGHNDLVRELRKKGVVAYGADAASPWADAQALAWELPFSDKSADWVTSFDLLEHLDRSRIPDVLREWRRVARCGIVVSISHRESTTAGPNGEILHRTVEPREWWVERIEEAGFSVAERLGHLVCPLRGA